MTRKRHILAWALTIIFVLAAAAAAYLLGSGQNPLYYFSGSIGRVESMSTAAPAETPPSSPEATPAYDPAAADVQRKQALEAYAAAYRATATNGFYSTTPVKIMVSNTDPATALPYTVMAALPTATGQIRYWPGGSCTGAPRIPGSIGTRFLALQTKLETSAQLYCVQVDRP